MSDDPTPLSLPSTLPYPIIITRLIPSSRSGHAIQRGSKILEYSFTSDTSRRALAKEARDGAGTGKESRPRKREKGEEEGVGENDMVGSWESPVEGEFVNWAPGVGVGMRIEKRHSARPILYIQQPCTHPVQLHGLCGVCGKELSENDYITPAPRADPGNLPTPGPSRFPGAYEMGHDSLGVTVSSREATRLDNQTKIDLLHARKLSLIVDLDQTIIHTTVDPTVGEWLDEIRQAEGVDGEGENTGTSTRWSRNPNTDALRDVATFQLEDELPPGAVKGRSRANDRWYFTKPRPGLPTFLEKMSEMYEMHVYTMGTRTYADAICKAIDPDGKIFGGRILSRDESGNVKSKHLKRLFPTDQSMVVVIDDRGDVWGEIPNLVKVIPYEFFLGIGDINSTPSAKGVRTDGKIGGKRSASSSPPSKSGQTAAPMSGSKKVSERITPSSPAESDVSVISTSPSPSISPLPMTPASDALAEIDGVEVVEAVDAEGKEEMLHRIEVERPLKRLAEKLEKERNEAEDDEGVRKDGLSFERVEDPAEVMVGENGLQVEGVTQDAGKIEERSTTPEGSPPPPPPMLSENDDELERLTGILSEIHHSFYSAYDARPSSATDDDPLPMGCDVELIIPDMKSRVLEGCSIVFSGIIPQGIRPELSEIWLLSLVYGARPLLSPSPQMTHCVCIQPGTEKTHRTQQMGKWVVKLDWMVQSLAVWKKLDEGPFDCYPEHTRRQLKGKGKAEGKVGEGEVVALPGDVKDEGGKEEAEILPEEEAEAEEELDDPDFAVGGWDEAAEKEFEAFLDGSDDGMSERGSISSPPSSIPGTPRKRVRYADEEDLPLSSFRDPPAKRASFDERGEEGESPERKRKRPLLLGPPSYLEEEGSGEVRKLELSEKQVERMKRQVQERQAEEEAGERGVEGDAEDNAGERGEEEASETGTEGEDEFARMLAESLDD